MKNILIGGTVRAGKSTLANLIRNKLNTHSLNVIQSSMPLMLFFLNLELRTKG